MDRTKPIQSPQETKLVVLHTYCQSVNRKPTIASFQPVAFLFSRFNQNGKISQLLQPIKVTGKPILNGVVSIKGLTTLSFIW